MNNNNFKLIFENWNNVSAFIQYMAEKIKKTGYFSLKDLSIMNADTKPIQIDSFAHIIGDWYYAEFYGWSDISLMTIQQSETQRLAVYIKEPILIIDKVEDYINKFKNEKEI